MCRPPLLWPLQEEPWALTKPSRYLFCTFRLDQVHGTLQFLRRGSQNLIKNRQSYLIYPWPIFFEGFGWNFQGLLTMVNLEFHFFFFFFYNNFLLSYLSFTFFPGFSRINTTFLFFNGFSYFLLLSFCCCPAELESVDTFEISLSVIELCQKY